MKATGIVRRIDDLGRVVIPKEIRKTLRIKEGTPLEIFTHSSTMYTKQNSTAIVICLFVTAKHPLCSVMRIPEKCMV